MRILWTQRYLSELQAVGDYIAERNPRAAASTGPRCYRLVPDVSIFSASQILINDW